MGYQRPRDLQPLQHSAREGARHVIHAVGVDLNLGKPVDRLLANVAVVSGALRHEPFADIATRGDIHAEVLPRVLMHEPPIGTVQRSQRRRGHRVHVVQMAGRITVPTAPPSGRRRPERTFSSVVLPDPELANDRKDLAWP